MIAILSAAYLIQVVARPFEQLEFKNDNSASCKVVTSEGKEVTVIINMALKRSRLNSLTSRNIGYDQASSVKLKLKQTDIALAEIQPEIFTFQDPALLAVDLILGRDAFKGKIVMWNCELFRISILDEYVADSPGYQLNTTNGTFTWDKKEWYLPSIMKFGLTSKNAFKGGALSVSSQTVEKVLRENELYFVQDHNRLRCVAYDPSVSDFEATSASFFGAQTVVIDFKNSRIHFNSRPIDNFIDSTGYICGVRFGFRNDKFWLDSWPDVFDYQLTGQPEMLAIGTVKLKEAYERRLEGFRDLLVESRKKGYFTVRVDNKWINVKNKLLSQ